MHAIGETRSNFKLNPCHTILSLIAKEKKNTSAKSDYKQLIQWLATINLVPPYQHTVAIQNKCIFTLYQSEYASVIFFFNFSNGASLSLTKIVPQRVEFTIQLYVWDMEVTLHNYQYLEERVLLALSMMHGSLMLNFRNGKRQYNVSSHCLLSTL